MRAWLVTWGGWGVMMMTTLIMVTTMMIMMVAKTVSMSISVVASMTRWQGRIVCRMGAEGPM